MGIRLTAKTVEAAKPDPAKRLEIADAAMPGLYLLIQKSGAKSWALRYRYAGKPRKMTLGAFPLFSLKDARDAAGAALRDLERGIDPGALKIETKRRTRDEPERDTVEAVVELFLKRHASRNKRPADVAAMFRRDILPAWGTRRIQDITRRDVVDLLDDIVDRGSPVTANRVRAKLNTLFGWAKGRDIVAANPVDAVRPPAPEKSRDRVLTEAEIALFWRACARLGPPFGALFRLLLLTAQRRGEVGGMREREIDGATWTIPPERSKNGDQHIVPLSAPALQIIKSVERAPNPDGFIFCTNGRASVSGFSRATTRLRAAMAEIAGGEVEPFTVHDLRRSAATHMAEMGIAPHVVEAILNHRGGSRRGVAAVYNRARYADEKRAALDAWAEHVVGIVGEQEKISAGR